MVTVSGQRTTPPHDPQENLGSASNREVKALVLMLNIYKILFFEVVMISFSLHFQVMTPKRKAGCISDMITELKRCSM